MNYACLEDFSHFSQARIWMLIICSVKFMVFLCVCVCVCVFVYWDAKYTHQYIHNLEIFCNMCFRINVISILGACPYNRPGATFAFAVLFNKGASVTAWTGKCFLRHYSGSKHISLNMFHCSLNTQRNLLTGLH